MMAASIAMMASVLIATFVYILACHAMTCLSYLIGLVVGQLQTGQFIGARGDFVPEQICRKLSLLHDQVWVGPGQSAMYLWGQGSLAWQL